MNEPQFVQPLCRKTLTAQRPMQEARLTNARYKHGRRQKRKNTLSQLRNRERSAGCSNHSVANAGKLDATCGGDAVNYSEGRYRHGRKVDEEFGIIGDRRKAFPNAETRRRIQLLQIHSKGKDAIDPAYDRDE